MRLFHERDGYLSSMEDFIEKNFTFVFFQGVFEQNCLLLDEDAVINLI